jgi:glycosyltransferase involved in cell wall biosynthesis
MRGGEKCLEVLCEHWPLAPLLTLFHVRGAVSSSIERRTIQTSVLQRLPKVERYYRQLLPIMPWAASTWRVPDCDLVVSTSHCVAKSVRVPASVPHICYCFTPMRYVWHLRDAYFGANPLGKLKAAVLDPVLKHLRAWDRRSAVGVTHFIAISRTVRKRIRECYGRDSTVIYPPADTDFYCPGHGTRENYYLAVSAFAPYKRLDLAITACSKLGRQLVLIGTGQDEKRLRSLGGSGVTFLGRQPDEEVRRHMRRCRALLFPGEEDFGIAPVEAMACGTPVIAYGRGGASETVIPLAGSTGHEARYCEEPTGLWFEEQTSDCLIAALQEFESRSGDFSPEVARKQALGFNRERFKNEFFAHVDRILATTERLNSRRAA